MERFWVKTHSKEPQRVLNVKNYHKKIQDFLIFIYFFPFETILIMEIYSFIKHMNVNKIELKIHLI